MIRIKGQPRWRSTAIADGASLTRNKVYWPSGKFIGSIEAYHVARIRLWLSHDGMDLVGSV